VSSPIAAILYAPGTNCHEETAAALERAGIESRLVLLRDLLDARARLRDYQAAVIPGGFSYGDHLGAGRVFAVLVAARLREEVSEFLDSGKPMLGICNGFQVLSEAGILPSRSIGERTMALLENQSAQFEDRKVRLAVSEQHCIWTEGLAGSILEMPSAHGEGRPLFRSSSPHIALHYASSSGAPALDYPDNPSGAPDAIAGITDETGLILGLMPHPERASLPAHDSQDGLKIFTNLARWLAR
jgi:phosphoribosylformylglycinamidine synthase subunit PurQ / glutaminase